MKKFTFFVIIAAFAVLTVPALLTRCELIDGLLDKEGPEQPEQPDPEPEQPAQSVVAGSFAGTGPDSAINKITEANTEGEPGLTIMLGTGNEEVEFGQGSLLSTGLVLNNTNSPANLVIDGGGDGGARTAALPAVPADGYTVPLITVGNGVTLTLRNITFTGVGMSGNRYGSSLIKVESGGTLILENGAGIKNAVRAWFADIPGAGGVTVFGKLIMKGGEISGNETTSAGNHGGGVYVGEGGEFTMKGGTISNNTIGDAWGGGVFVTGAGSTFSMENGTISGNAARYGGGVFAYDDGTFTMEGGTIKDNQAVGDGGGVVAYNGDFKKTGGTIYGDTDKTHTPDTDENTAATGNGHAVYVEIIASSIERKYNSTAYPLVGLDSGTAANWE